MHSRPPHPVRAGLLCLGLVCLELIALVPASRAISVSEVVKAFCLSAYQANLQKEGKTATPAQLDRTCGCVGEKVSEGSDVEDAHVVCGRSQEQRSVQRSLQPPSP
jgi:hypothetical protein